MELEHKVYLAILACNLLHCYIIPLSVQDSNSLDSLPRTWHKAVGAVQATSALTCSRSNGLATHYNSTCTCIYIHSSMPQQLNIESTESLSCTVSGTSIRIKSAVGVVAQLCTCRNDGYRLQQFNKVQEHVRLPC